jgi:hypothetical protein
MGERSKATFTLKLEQQRRALEERQKSVRTEFIQVELELAITFCQIALCSGDREKIERNQAHAREAHESALRFLSTIAPAEPIKKEIERKLEHLQKLLDEVTKNQRELL